MTSTERRPARPDQDHLYNILVLYDPDAVRASTVVDHLDSLRLYSGFRVFYADCCFDARCHLDLELFDAVVIHYSCGLYHRHLMNPSFRTALKAYGGTKVAFTQDEYDQTDVLVANLAELGIHLFFTCVAEANIKRVYPPEKLPGLRFVTTLTGYVPLNPPAEADLKPLAERTVVIGYRGRDVHYRYGRLGRMKLNIGVRMKAICEERGIPCDIGWTEADRIYWNRWSEFLGNCRVSLASESGFNVFDRDGSLRQRIDAARAAEPGLSYADVEARFLAGEEGRYGAMSQIPPRVFEAIAHKSALVLFEGAYSGVVEPDRHYIPLRHDFGNVDDVLRRVADLGGLTEMVERTYEDVVLSGRYSYRSFAVGFADHLRPLMGRPRGATLFSVVTSASRTPRQADAALEFVNARPASSEAPTQTRVVTTEPLSTTEAKALFEHLYGRTADLPELVGPDQLPTGPVLVFGTAQGARLLHRALAARGIAVAAFIDHAEPGEMLGHPVLTPPDLPGRFPPDIPVLLSNRFLLENARAVATHGFLRCFNALPLIRVLLDEAGP